MNVTREKAIRLIFLIFLLYGVSSTIISPLIPWISARLDIGYDKIGMLLLYSTISGILSTFAAGRLCDSHDIKKIILVGLIIAAVGFLLFGVYLTFATLIVSLIFLRFGYGIMDTSGYAYGSRLFEGNHSFIYMKMELFWYVGSIISPLLIGGMLYLGIHPKLAFFLFAVIYLATIVLFQAISPTMKKAQPDEGNDAKKKKVNPKSILFFVREPTIICATLALFFFVGAVIGLSSWLTTYFLAFDMAIYQGSLVLSLFWAALSLGLFVARKIIKKTNEITIILIGNLLGVICVFAFSVVNIILIKIIFLMLVGFFVSGICSLTLALSVSRRSDQAGSIVGFMVAGIYTSGIVFQPLLGYVAENIGEGFVIYIVLAGMVASLAINFVLFRLLKKENSTKLILFSKFRAS